MTTPKVPSPKMCPMQSQWEYAYLTDNLSNDARYRVGVKGTPIVNHPQRLLWSRDPKW